ncbi:flagellar brake domain-containing protein [Psychromonas hadalis]|uniref:flagellar brake domain-containing protein n=1 Tax=Psychromonas hadalis TaxID=211669 RepID=UPI0004192038|nr:flagellar brake domain-containing protein [Psychromonas hadalis]
MSSKADEKYSYLNKIACETEVHLQIITPTQPVRLKTRLIGVDANMSVIVAMGSDGEWISAKQYIREGQKVIVRLISTDQPDANLIAFQTHIQKLMSIAGRWLVLDYPKAVQQLSLRQHLRVPVYIEAKLLHPETKKISSSGFLSDLSLHGGAFIGESIKQASLDKKYILQVLVEGEKKSIVITIKNRKRAGEKGSSVQYGLIIEADEKLSKQFVEPLLVSSLLN